jgi:hypothetical protein
MYRPNPEYNITFCMRATADGGLDIDRVSKHVHQGVYTCTPMFSNGTQCSRTDSFDMTVIALFIDVTEKPVLLSHNEQATYGSIKVACVAGTSPGINASSTSWQRDGVTIENSQDVSSECPTCKGCSDKELLRYTTLPSVQSRLRDLYPYSAFVISTGHVVVKHKDYSDCVPIKNRYVSFLVISEFTDRDEGV